VCAAVPGQRGQGRAPQRQRVGHRHHPGLLCGRRRAVHSCAQPADWRAVRPRRRLDRPHRAALRYGSAGGSASIAIYVQRSSASAPALTSATLRQSRRDEHQPASEQRARPLRRPHRRLLPHVAVPPPGAAFALRCVDPRSCAAPVLPARFWRFVEQPCSRLKPLDPLTLAAGVAPHPLQRRCARRGRLLRVPLPALRPAAAARLVPPLPGACCCPVVLGPAACFKPFTP